MPQISVYDRRYADGGWKYQESTEVTFLKVMLEAAGLTPPARIVEVACGQGFHTNLLYKMSYDVVGNDMSEVGIQNARRMWPEIQFCCADSQRLPDMLGYNEFDGLLVRGHSHHHYDLPLNGMSQKNVDVVYSTRRMFDLVRAGGMVMMTIRTNFSGELHELGVVNNEASTYVSLFLLFGDVVFIGDRNGTRITSDEHARELGKLSNSHVVVITRKR